MLAVRTEDEGVAGGQPVALAVDDELDAAGQDIADLFALMRDRPRAAAAGGDVVDIALQQMHVAERDDPFQRDAFAAMARIEGNHRPPVADSSWDGSAAAGRAGFDSIAPPDQEAVIWLKSGGSGNHGICHDKWIRRRSCKGPTQPQFVVPAKAGTHFPIVLYV